MEGKFRIEHEVFPVPTGMNRMKTYFTLSSQGVPRAHGDEPARWYLDREINKCSPCPRG